MVGPLRPLQQDDRTLRQSCHPLEYAGELLTPFMPMLLHESHDRRLDHKIVRYRCCSSVLRLA